MKRRSVELKKAFDLRKVAVVIYSLAFLVFLIVGFIPAEATTQYSVDGRLVIPEIQLESDVTNLILYDNKLETPDYIVGSFSQNEGTTLLIGHSSNVFRNLSKLAEGSLIYYNDQKYLVRGIVTLEKSKISMKRLLSANEGNAIVMMTCAGEDLGGGDATHRLIIFATEA